MTKLRDVLPDIALVVNASVLPIAIIAFISGEGEVVHACATAGCIATGVSLGASLYGRYRGGEVTHG